MENIKVLIIDDHAIITRAVEMFFENIQNEITEYNFRIHKAESCEQAYHLILGKNPMKFDVIILDIQMPPYEAKKIYSGEDLGHVIKTKKKDVNLIIMTSLTDSYRLYTIFKNLNPDGILIKGDINERTIVDSVLAVLKGKTYYSVTFSALIRNQHSIDYILDETDRKLLFYLSAGFKTMTLPDKLRLSLTAIEKRKRNLKKIFEIEGNSDFELIHEAKKRDFL